MKRTAQLTRRQFAAAAGGGVMARAQQKPRPNILWITCEDTGPHLGCYGDSYSVTPNLDALAGKGVIYRNAWSNAPVCAPARTTIISGMFPPSTGSEHMRSMTRLPAGMKMYPAYLGEAGYYTTNNNKEDYNLEKEGVVWSESSTKAHWRNRKPGQPFFAIFNFTTTHESQVRRRPYTLVHDPAKVRIPAYHPDTPEVRHDWAQYYDNITTMDGQAGDVLKQLEADGLAADTIVFFYGDHGPGIARSKRWPYNSGLHVPLIVYIPPKFRHLAPKDYKPGGRIDRLVGFVDLAPTLLSLAGVKPPAHLQGSAFLGEHIGPEPEYQFGFRGRMDERYDLVRSVRDKRYVYLRQYMPHKIYGQFIAYLFETPTTQVWRKLYDEGKLKPPRTYFWEKKPPEELYDLESDRDEVNNLARSPQHQAILNRLRKAQRDFALKIRDVGFLPEDEIHSRAKGSTPYEVGHDPRRYPMERVLKTAEVASSLDAGATPALVKALEDADSAVRFWAAMGLRMREQAGVKAGGGALRKAVDDSSPSVRVVAAEALGLYGEAVDLDKILQTLVSLAEPGKNSVFVCMLAWNAIGELGAKARPLKERLAAMPVEDPAKLPRTEGYVRTLKRKVMSDLG
jgi:uncharacterized sulfatase